jgi:carbon storage regulator
MNCIATKEHTTMLILTRKRGEDVLIGGDIRLTVVAVNGGRVQLGIHAPRAIPIVRKELLDAAPSDAAVAATAATRAPVAT